MILGYFAIYISYKQKLNTKPICSDLYHGDFYVGITIILLYRELSRKGTGS